MPEDDLIPGCTHVPARAARCVGSLWKQYRAAWWKIGLDSDEFESTCLAAIMVDADRKWSAERGANPAVYATQYARWKILERMKAEVGQTNRPEHRDRVAFARKSSIFVENADGERELLPEVAQINDSDECSTVMSTDEIIAVARKARCSEREIDILSRRFIRGETLDKTATALGVSRERVRQLQLRAIERMRDAFASPEDLLAGVSRYDIREIQPAQEHAARNTEVGNIVPVKKRRTYKTRAPLPRLAIVAATSHEAAIVSMLKSLAWNRPLKNPQSATEATRRAAGLCERCGGSREGSDTRTTCVSCAREARLRNKKRIERIGGLTISRRIHSRRMERVAAGLCYYCKEPRHPESKRVCAKHLVAKRVNQREYMLRCGRGTGRVAGPRVTGRKPLAGTA